MAKCLVYLGFYADSERRTVKNTDKNAENGMFYLDFCDGFEREVVKIPDKNVGNDIFNLELYKNLRENLR
ncbi:MAG: hypothetical protein J5802_11485 [Butyrivibrio sp.]|nr:hypothetical protein [Butyrivibrio sp.]